MHTTTRFALNFSDPEVYGQQQVAIDQLRRLDLDDHIMRARLLAILTATSVVTDLGAARAAAAQARVVAEQSENDLVRAWSLLASCVADLSCEATPQRLIMAREILRIAQETGESEFVQTAFFLYLAALAELGEMSELDLALSPVGPFLPRFPGLADGRHVTWFRCLQATLGGDVKHAEQLAQQGYGLAQRSGDPDGQAVFIGQLGIIRWAQGRVVDLEPQFLQARQAAPHEPVWGVSLAWIWLKQGRRSAARALVSSLPDPATLPVDRNWLSTACILAEVASKLGESKIAHQLYSLLLPFQDRLVTIGLGVTCWGTVSRSLALTAACAGNKDAAIKHYRYGIEVASQRGAHPWLAELQWELAALLAERASPGDENDAILLATEAIATARALHLYGIEERAAAFLASLQTTPSPVHAVALAISPTTPTNASGTPRITVFGGFDVTAVDGTTPRWQSRKARQLLKILVARRGATISRESLMEMIWPGIPPDRLANRFAVAVTAVRRSLDPGSTHPRDTYLENRDGLLRLRIEALDIDVENFLARARSALLSTAPVVERIAMLTEILALYTGEPLQEEQEALWAAEFRGEAQLAFFSVAHDLAGLLAEIGDHYTRRDIYRRVLALDEFDQRAHVGLIDAFVQLGSYGQAEVAKRNYAQCMESLGVPLDLDSAPSAS